MLKKLTKKYKRISCGNNVYHHYNHKANVLFFIYCSKGFKYSSGMEEGIEIMEIPYIYILEALGERKI